MKLIGLIGGTGPESTIDYYKKLVEGYRKKTENKENPHILINSIDLVRVMSRFRENKLDELATYLLNELNRLIEAGADFVAISANTPHLVYSKIKPHISVPFISIVEETAKVVQKNNQSTVGLLGTAFTMKSGFYPDVFEAYNLSCISPDEKDMETVHDIYVNELIYGIFKDESRQKLISVINKLKTEKKVEGIILGGTELPLILSQEHIPDIKIYDTTKIHVNSIIEMALG